jgi:hypothetical protein
MFDHRGDEMPTQYLHGEKTRDAAQVLAARMWALSWNMFALTAEYAANITTIPPRSAKRKEATGRALQVYAGGR